MTSAAPLFFEFEQENHAIMALDMLEELGYKPQLLERFDKPTLHLHLDGQEVTSALEIAQAYGGQLVERPHAASGEAAFAMAYGLEGSIAIPAHTVNEDWPDGYAQASSVDWHDALPDDDEASFDPSADDYNHFRPGIRL
ncbi:hypothetical protein B5M42_007635 [Paenibacillus athensensis]|uniref:Uncharacterized protein n=1 Tax=Paenibacillus athensensis TaxID=1967502 RepID=A0A4Y8Q2N8_9BACL|nr:hypothetical protein [Paenibacillus athensensis]MCD1258704.1 hypothetical protein [Paenibacillus athensensis]